MTFPAILTGLLALLVFLFVLGITQVHRATTYRITCETKGATLLNKRTPDHLYVTFYCVKNGVIVP